MPEEQHLDSLAGSIFRLKEAPCPKEEELLETSFKVGEYRVGLQYDRSVGLFVGCVTNRNYPVRLHAETPTALRIKFEHVLIHYLGARHQSPRARN